MSIPLLKALVATADTFPAAFLNPPKARQLPTIPTAKFKIILIILNESSCVDMQR